MKLFLGCVVLFWGCILRDAQGQTRPEEWKDLLSTQEQVRFHAQGKLRTQREEMERFLTDRLRELARSPDRTHLSSLHLVIGVISTWRVELAAPCLIEILNYQLDPKTIPAGDRVGPAYYFPAAAALAHIGGSTVCRGILRRLTKEDDPKLMRLCVWVLYKLYEEDLEAVLPKRQEETEDEAIRKRLSTARKIASEGRKNPDAILIPLLTFE